MIRSIQTCHNAIDLQTNPNLLNKLKYDHRIREFQLGNLEGAFCDTDSIPYEKQVSFWDVVLKGFIVPLGSEGGNGLKKRVAESLADADEGLNLYFAHSGVIYTQTYDFLDRVFIGNCGAAGFVFDDYGVERDLVGLFFG